MPRRPNLLLITTDQQRGDCLSSDGHPVLLTPVMDSIGGGGTRFRRAYTTCPSCVPARRCLLSGQFPINNDMVGMTTSPWDPPTTLPRELQAAGYQTAIVGRVMHQYRPDSFYGFEYVAEDYGSYLSENQPTGGGGLRGHGAHFWRSRAVDGPAGLRQRSGRELRRRPRVADGRLRRHVGRAVDDWG